MRSERSESGEGVARVGGDGQYGCAGLLCGAGGFLEGSGVGGERLLRWEEGDAGRDIREGGDKVAQAGRRRSGGGGLDSCRGFFSSGQSVGGGGKDELGRADKSGGLAVAEEDELLVGGGSA